MTPGRTARGAGRATARDAAPAVRPIEHVQGASVVIGGRRLVSFGGCDYLGLAKHDDVVAAAHAGLDFFGASASASRTTIGTMEPHVVLERTLADYFGTRAAIHFAAGWLAPQAAARALAPECDAVLLDGGVHPALDDAATLTGLPVRRFRHLDAADARRLAGKDRILVLTDGTPRPLRALAALVERNRGHLVVDDAHGVGVLGPLGRGALELTGVSGRRVHLTGSLSKAFGSAGGFVVGSPAFIDKVRARAAVVAGATPLSPAAATAAECALQLAAGVELRVLLWRNVARLRRHLKGLGIRLPRERTPWFALGAALPPSAVATWSRALDARGFLVPSVTYYGDPPGTYLKVTVTALHTAAEIDALAAALSESMPAA